MSARFNNLDQQNQHIISSILRVDGDVKASVSQALREEMTAVTGIVAQLLRRLDSMSQEVHDLHNQTQCTIMRQIYKRDGLRSSNNPEIAANIEMLSVSTKREEQLRGPVRNGILRSLDFEGMTKRYENVGEAHPKTFEWAFAAPAEEKTWSDFSGWLREGEGVYWVSGKAGSGKSTFMKHLVSDDQNRLHSLLDIWAGDSSLCVATFFFWESGTGLQKSQLGLLRTLLFCVLRQHPNLTPIIFPKEWSSLYSDELARTSSGFQNSMLPADFRPSWTLSALKKALRILGSQTAIPLKICFVIDGLDELDGDDGDHEEMGELFNEVTKSKLIKVCASSRPWVVFEDLFEHSPKMKLQNLTYRDIQMYVHDKFYANNGFRALEPREPEGASGLLKEIVDKADGVFLWVKIVVRLLLNGVRNRDDLADLWGQVRRLPRELKPLYNSLLDRIEPYKEWASQAIQILRCNRELCELGHASDGWSQARLRILPIRISEFSLAMRREKDLPVIETITRKEFQHMVENASVRLTARCAGLIEVSYTSTGLRPRSKIQYFHRTAKDFLESPEVWARLLIETEKTSFNPRVALMGSYLRCIRVKIAFFEELARQRDDLERDVLERDDLHSDCELDVIREVFSFMTCAFQADSHLPSRATQTTLLNQMEELIAKYDAKGHWLYDYCPGFPGRYRVLEYMALFSSQNYVRHRFELLEAPQRHAIATSLLQFLLREGFAIVSNWQHHHVTLVSFLLELGADVSSFISSSRVAIRGAHICLENIRKRAAEGPEVHTQAELDAEQIIYTRLAAITGTKQAFPTAQPLQ